MALRSYEQTETAPCARCRVTLVTFVPDGKMHWCDACKSEIKVLAEAFWASFDGLDG